MILTTYTGKKLFPLRYVTIQVTYSTQHESLPLLVVPGDWRTLLGRNWLEKIKINWSDLKLVSSPFLTLDQVLGQQSKIFTLGVGKLKDVTAKICVNPEAQPCFFRACPIPHSLKEKVAKELQHLQDMQIITPVKHSEWAAPIIPVVKSENIVHSWECPSTPWTGVHVDHVDHARPFLVFINVFSLESQMTSIALNLPRSLRYTIFNTRVQCMQILNYLMSKVSIFQKPIEDNCIPYDYKHTS